MTNPERVVQHGPALVYNPFRVETRVTRGCFPGVREYATPGWVVQPLRGKEQRSIAIGRATSDDSENRRTLESAP
jgi:hypothetical protein